MGKAKAYSPDLNPSEEMISKLKCLPQSAAARTVDDLIGATWDAFWAVTPGNILGWFNHPGFSYVQQGSDLKKHR